VLALKQKIEGAIFDADYSLAAVRKMHNIPQIERMKVCCLIHSAHFQHHLTKAISLRRALKQSTKLIL
jgi:hypothetical protein